MHYPQVCLRSLVSTDTENPQQYSINIAKTSLQFLLKDSASEVSMLFILSTCVNVFAQWSVKALDVLCCI